MNAHDVQIEHWPEKTRIDLPRRELGNWRFIGLVPLVFGLFFGWMPFGFFARFIGNALGGRFDPMELIFLGFLSLFLIAALVPIGLGLLVMFGRTRVVIGADRIKITEIAGPVRYSRGIRTANIERIEVGRPRQGNVESPLMKLGAVTAYLKNGKQAGVLLGYPDDVLQLVSSEMVTRLRMSGAQTPVTERAFEPDKTEKPEALREVSRPADSNITMGHGATLEMTVPSRGLRKESWGLFPVALVWNLVVFGIIGGMVVQAVRRGGVRDWGFLPFVLGFAAIGITLLLTAIHLGRRRFTIRADRSRLELGMQSPFRSRQWSWPAGELAMVVVGDSGTKVNDQMLLQLQVHTRDGKKQGLMTGRDPEELRWVAWSLSQALGLEGGLTGAEWPAKFKVLKS